MPDRFTPAVISRRRNQVGSWNDLRSERSRWHGLRTEYNQASRVVRAGAERVFLVLFSFLTSGIINLYIAKENLLRVSCMLMSLDFSGLAWNAGRNLFCWQLLSLPYISPNRSSNDNGIDKFLKYLATSKPQCLGLSPPNTSCSSTGLACSKYYLILVNGYKNSPSGMLSNTKATSR